MSAKVGDLVKWYELYADQIVKDAGTGVVMNVRNINYYDGSYKNKIYDVYRFQRSDIHAFIDYNIEKLEDQNV
tara:strand:- start:268 stop:486 length:219 start_codon:yes stop_codon:yes gene_type:complete